MREGVSEGLRGGEERTHLLDGGRDVLGGDGDVVAERLLVGIDREVVPVVGEVASPAQRKRVSFHVRRRGKEEDAHQISE